MTCSSLRTIEQLSGEGCLTSASENQTSSEAFVWSYTGKARRADGPTEPALNRHLVAPRRLLIRSVPSDLHHRQHPNGQRDQILYPRSERKPQTGRMCDTRESRASHRKAGAVQPSRQEKRRCRRFPLAFFRQCQVRATVRCEIRQRSARPFIWAGSLQIQLRMTVRR